MLLPDFLAALGAALLGLALHPFTTYPLSLTVLAWLRPRPHRAAPLEAGCKVAICVCAYNEAPVIAARIDNLLQLRATLPGLDILVYVDAASDGTAAIVRSYGTAIRAYIAPKREGKSSGMNRLVAMTDADLIVFSDANVTFLPDALQHLLAPFADARVGCVCGHLIYTASAAPGSTARTGSLYWRLEERIKELESRIGSVMGADGSIFAIRRRLHRPPPVDLIDDMFVSLSILCSGYRIVRADRAKAFEQSISVSSEEFRRKIRIACQAVNVHRALWRSLRRLSPLTLYMYGSHKFVRWMTIYLLGSSIGCFMAALLCAGAYTAAASLVGTAVVAGAWAFAVPGGRLGVGADIVAALTATGLGVLRSLTGRRYQTWSSPGSSRPTLTLPSLARRVPASPAMRDRGWAHMRQIETIGDYAGRQDGPIGSKLL
jgi:cellulose synthase/poly-beta-1,6-N-acetylglucosamine synthase-like glycosyltransferase